MILITITLLLVLAVVTLAVYVPSSPLPVVYVSKVYIISMNLTHGEPPLSYIDSLKLTHPLAYGILINEENVTAPWLGVAGLRLTLIIANATSMQYPILLKSTSVSGLRGGVEWVVNLTYPVNLMPQPLSLSGRWLVSIVASVGGFNYTVFLFITGSESLGDVLGNLTSVNGYLIEANGFKYYLWHHYLYNGSLYYGVPLPGVTVFYSWFGNDLNASFRVTSLPVVLNNLPFPSYLRYFTITLNQFYKGVLVNSTSAGVDYLLGGETDYGYRVFNISRLAPLGPLVYYSPILMLPNGSLINPSCLPMYYELTVNLGFINPAYGNVIPVTLLNEQLGVSGITVINGSLILGGYLVGYDFYNLTYVKITPLGGLLGEGVLSNACTLITLSPSDSTIRVNTVNTGYWFIMLHWLRLITPLLIHYWVR
ncbi:hypothetical protein Cmaq_1501 [Caldivirga maquilingensis IC-167]|uniref:Uncharacterized protein n=1 Tax=Caldivirga maquilingensis (strain ATCC 700844 / DSM 13496 / JCM 10307 / IC-167) TaxID=397948 RepID=A8M9A6_CALMQ|nr:hypothetical protein Cmaq_1501 [Caldivirga maquilingensis IC-167]